MGYYNVHTVVQTEATNETDALAEFIRRVRGGDPGRYMVFTVSHIGDSEGEGTPPTFPHTPQQVYILFETDTGIVDPSPPEGES